MGVVLPFRRREVRSELPEHLAVVVATMMPSYLRQMVYDYPVFRMETDGEYAARLKRLES